MRELEAALRADLRDETQWSVYADWLESQGDPRAELIRYEQRAVLTDDRAEAHQWRKRAEQLFARDHRAWLGNLNSVQFEPTWTRGCVTEARIMASPVGFTRALLGARLGRLAWRLSYDLLYDASLAAVAAVLADSSVDVVELTRFRGEALASLAAVEGLRELFVDRARITDIEALGSLPALERLCLRRCELGLGAIAESGDFSALRHLELVACRGPDSLTLELAGLARLDKLEVLSLSSAGVRDLDALGGLSQLRILDLSHVKWSLESGFEALLQLPKLERIDVHDASRWELQQSLDQVVEALQGRGVEVVRESARSRTRFEARPAWETAEVVEE